MAPVTSEKRSFYRFFHLLKVSVNEFYRNPLILLTSLALFICITLFSNLSLFIDQQFRTNTSKTIWLILFILVALLIGSFLFSGMLGLCVQAVKKKRSLKYFGTFAVKFWFRNFLVIISLLLVTAFIQGMALIVANIMQPLVGQDIASLLLFFIALTGILSVLIFLTFTSPMLVIYNLSVILSMRKSVSLVKKTYLQTLSFLIIFFVLYQLVNFIPYLWLQDILKTLVLFPYFSLSLIQFVITFDKT